MLAGTVADIPEEFQHVCRSAGVQGEGRDASPFVPAHAHLAQCCTKAVGTGPYFTVQLLRSTGAL